jgi:isochorismate hydrolase
MQTGCVADECHEICEYDTRSRPHPAQQPQQRIDAVSDTLKDLQTTAGLLYEFCEWFCDYDCEEKPCTVTVSRLHERLEGIKKQMEMHPEYLAKWDAKRAEQRALLQDGEQG